MGDYSKLRVWVLSQELVASLYAVSREIPSSFGDLGEQLRRAALSMSNDISEGSDSE